MTKETKRKKLTDNFLPLTKGFCAALRNKEYFLMMNDIFIYMNKFYREIDPGDYSRTYFLDKVYKSKDLGSNWLKICTLYEKGYAPIRAYAPDQAKNKEDTEKSDAKPLSPEEEETEILSTKLSVIYPPPDGLDDGMRSFVKFFKKTKRDKVHEDFTDCLRSLNLTCSRLASFKSPKEQALLLTDPEEAMAIQERRVQEVRSLFATASTQFVCSNSTVMKEILADPDIGSRIPFLAGEGATSMDGQLGGFHGAGLVCFIGGTSGFKSGVKSSIIANHILDAAAKPENDPATVWGYIGEDGVESYTKRILTNILNRRPFSEFVSFNEFSIGDINGLISDTENDHFRNVSFELMETVLSNCYWIKSPEDPRAKLKFSVINILEAFDAKLNNGDKKPRFIILDYLNLLKLPHESSTPNRAMEVSMIAHMLDEWSQQRGIPVVTSVQASASGAVQARDMRFYNQEDIHECKSVQHHCRMMVSLLPYTDYSDPESLSRQMAFKILKNRDGQKDLIFVSSLYEGKNQTLLDSVLYSESEWNQHATNIVNKKNEIFAGEMDTVPKSSGHGISRPGAGKKSGFIKQGRGESRGAGGSQKKSQPMSIDQFEAMDEEGNL